MTRVQGDLKIITGTAEAVTEVWVRSKVARPVPGGWLMTANDRKPVFNGKVDLELLPGACVLVAVSSGLPGETVELIVPESGTASLEACIRAAEAAGDLERDALDELRRDFGAWIDEVRASVGAADGSAKAAKAEADKAKGSADAAGKSATAAAGSASAAKTSADNAGKSAAAADGSATAADKSRSDASSFANSAKTASEQATARAQSAAESAGAAKADAGKAATAATKASGSATSAKADADRAKTSADSASTSASAAKGSADAAKASADAAGKSATAAASSASAAKTDAGKAATSATNADKSASAAKADADRAVGVVDSVQWNGDRLTVAGKTSPSLRGEKGEPGGVRGIAVEGNGTDPQATGSKSLALGWGSQATGHYSAAIGYDAQARGSYNTAVGRDSLTRLSYSTAVGYGAKAEKTNSTAIGAEAVATEESQTRIGNPDSKYHVSLAGDVRLTQEPSRDDNAATKKYVDSAVQNNTTPPTWEKVEGKPSEFPPSAHKHTLADITNAPNSHTSAATANTLVSRDSGGRAQFATPTSTGHAANKAYVDGAVRDKADKSYVDSQDAEVRAFAQSRPAFFSGAGSPPSTIPGAVVGDYYLDETTMELHKITGV